jgi:hypothetical protein
MEFWRTGSYNFDIDAFTHKFMLDVTDAQNSAGAFSDVSPNILGPGPGAPGWGDAGIFIPYAAWLQYGDVTLVERSWPAMQHWMDFIAANNPDYLRKKLWATTMLIGSRRINIPPLTSSEPLTGRLSQERWSKWQRRLIGQQMPTNTNNNTITSPQPILQPT